VLHHGILSCSREYEFVFGNTSAGGLQVLQNGQEMRGASVIMAGAMLLGKRIAIGEGVLVESGPMIKEPAIIGDCTAVRPGAYLRGYCLVGERCVVGHTTEVKHSIFLDDAKAGHFAYLGDSILGNEANLGAGTKFANLRFLGGSIQIRTPDGQVDTGMRKFGAILGDRAQTGCNSVTNPGTLLGPEAILMPYNLTFWFASGQNRDTVVFFSFASSCLRRIFSARSPYSYRAKKKANRMPMVKKRRRIRSQGICWPVRWRMMTMKI
jgi:hypothetical protein